MTATIHKLYSTDNRDSVYFRAFPTHVEHWGPKIDGTAHDTIEQGRGTYRRYLELGYKKAKRAH
jgi:hypothetical protein